MQLRNVTVNRALGTVAYAACAVSTASAEIDLARACGFSSWIVWCLPAALDVYVLVSLRVRRDVAFAVGVLLAVVATSHLVSSGLLEVSRWVVIGVSCVAPLILWRVHGLLWGDQPVETVPAALQEPVTVRQEAPPAPVVELEEPLEDEACPLEEAVEPQVSDLEGEEITQEALIELLVDNGEPLPGRSRVMQIYGVSEHTAKMALQKAKARLQETDQSLQLTKEK